MSWSSRGHLFIITTVRRPLAVPRVDRLNLYKYRDARRLQSSYQVYEARTDRPNANQMWSRKGEGILVRPWRSDEANVQQTHSKFFSYRSTPIMCHVN